MTPRDILLEFLNDFYDLTPSRSGFEVSAKPSHLLPGELPYPPEEFRRRLRSELGCHEYYQVQVLLVNFRKELARRHAERERDRARQQAEEDARESARVEEAKRQQKLETVKAWRERLHVALKEQFLATDVSSPAFRLGMPDDAEAGELLAQEKGRFVEDWAKAHLDHPLDPEQARAVATLDRHVLVTARAGSGKTRTLVASHRRLDG